MGSLLARASLLMKDWGADPDAKPSKLLWVEAGLTALIVFGGYLTAGYFLLGRW